MKLHKDEIESTVIQTREDLLKTQYYLDHYKEKIRWLKVSLDIESYLLEHTNYRNLTWKHSIINIVDAHEKKLFTRLEFTKMIMKYISEKKLHIHKIKGFKVDDYLREILSTNHLQIKYKDFQSLLQIQFLQNEIENENHSK